MSSYSYNEQFQNMVLMLSPSNTSENYTVDSEQLDAWLTKYDEWYMNADAKLSESWLYHKEVTVIGSDLFAYPQELKKVLAVFKKHKMSILLQSDIFELYTNFTLIQELSEQQLVHILYIDSQEGERIEEDAKLVSFIKQLYGLHKQVFWLNSLRFLQRKGILSQEFMNREYVTFYEFGKERNLPGENEKIIVKKEYIGSPCKDLMKICIADDGYVYPCSGVMGMQKFAISHITDEQPMKRLEENSIPCFSIPDLLMHGPLLHSDLEELTHLENASLGVCELHRMESLESDY